MSDHLWPGVSLTDHDRALLEGAEGEAAARAMRIVLRMAAIQGADRLIDISSVHVGGSIYTGTGSLAVLEEFVALGAKVRVPTTLNSISVDLVHGMESGASEAFTSNAARVAQALTSMGALSTFTCTPYVYANGPKLGDDILWAESNAIAYANSVIGARTNRHGDFMDVCAAITGRVPYSGLHRPENRVGQCLIRVPQVTTDDPAWFTALGYLVGSHAGSEVPVVTGIEGTPSPEAMRSFCATVATAGAVGLFHMVGVTPEAPTIEAAFGGGEPSKVVDVGLAEIKEVWQQLSTGTAPTLQFVALGSPHAMLGDFEELAHLTRGRTKHAGVDVLITTSRLVEDRARELGYLEPIEAFGIRVSNDRCLCMLNESLIPPGTSGVMTNSGKFAHYGPGLVRRGVYFGSTADCVESAVQGRPVLGLPKWLSGTSASPTLTTPAATTSA